MASSLLAQFSSFVSGMRLIDGGDMQKLAGYLFSVQSGITALAGGGLTGAPVLAASYNEIVTVASGGDSVALPPATPGLQVDVNNNGAQSLNVFGSLNPGNAWALDVVCAHGGTTTATSAAQGSGLVAAYVCFKAGVWKQVLSA